MNIIDKMCAPTQFEVQPVNTIYKVNNDNGNFSYYIQLSSDEKMNWQPIYYMLDCIFKDKFYINEEFMSELIALYQDKTKSFNTLTTVLRSRER